MVAGPMQAAPVSAAQGEASQIVLSIAGDPATSRSVSWSTPAMLSESGGIQYSADESFGTVSSAAITTTRPFGASGVYRHEALLTDLAPGNYYYRVKNSEGADDWSAALPFTVADVAAGEDVTFLYMGDVQAENAAGYNAWGELLQDAYERNPNAAFGVMGGDMVNNANIAAEWAEFLGAATGVFSKIPMMSAIGNHEVGTYALTPSRKPSAYLDLLALPKNGPAGYEEEFYAFDCGNARIIVLSSNYMNAQESFPNEQDGLAVKNWIGNQLDTAGAKWKIVVMHHPAFPVTSDKTADGVRAEWLPVFEEKGVDLILCGHQQEFSRSFPIMGDDWNADGPVQIMGNAGTKFYPANPYPPHYIERQIENLTNYQTVLVTQDKLTVKTFDADGTESDAWSKDRNNPAAKPDNYYPEPEPQPEQGGEKYVYVYAKDAAGKDVLMSTLSFGALSALSHGNPDNGGKNYYYSYTDNMPAARYTEARGFTIQELAAYLTARAPAAAEFRFAGDDSLSVMASDYSEYIVPAVSTYTALYGEDRYYFPSFFDDESGWKQSWETAKGATDADYAANASDAKYHDNGKDETFNDENKVKAAPILAMESFGGRIDDLSDYIAPGGDITGALENELDSDRALRLCMGLTEQQLRTGERTAHDFTYSIYRLRFHMKNSPIVSKGTVAAPTVHATYDTNAKAFTVTLASETPDAEIFYSLERGAPSPQYKYTGALTVAYASGSLPVIHTQAVRPGFDDAGVKTYVISADKDPQLPDDPPPAENPQTPTDSSSGTGFAPVENTSRVYAEIGASGVALISSNELKEATSLQVKSAAGAGNLVLEFDRNAVRALAASGNRLSIAAERTEAAKLAPERLEGYTDSLKVETDMSRPVYVIEALAGTEKLSSLGSGKVGITVDYEPGADVRIDEIVVFMLNDDTVTMITDCEYDEQKGVLKFTADGFGIFLPGNPNERTKRFNDVAKGDWYYDCIRSLADYGIVNGLPDESFAPNANITRAEFIRILYNMAPEATKNNSAAISYIDVRQGSWYYYAVAWGGDAGVAFGSDGAFRPGDPVTRQEAAVMLERYMNNISETPLTSVAETVDFTDKNGIAAWAGDAVSAMQKAGIINGMENADGSYRFEPAAGATRAEAAKMIYEILM
jgi:hypothetical protein